MNTVPDRISWAVDVVDPGPADRLLEFGCGPGVAAELVCARLTEGTLVAIDRSAVAVAKTRRRNAEHVRAGSLDVRECALTDLRLPAGSLDQAFGVDVNVFWTSSAEGELAVLRAALRRGGRLSVLYGTGPTGPDRITAVVADRLRTSGFADIEILRSPHGTGITGMVT
jgi:SAM-dependent methyltransferase